MFAQEKLKRALEAIAGYTDGKTPKTLPEAEHMLALIWIIASETLTETKSETAELVP